MEHRVRVRYDRAIIAEAARHFAVRAIGRVGFAAFALVLVSVGFLIASGDRSWLVGAIGAVAAIAAAVGASLFLVPYRRSLARLEQMPSGEAEFTFGEAGIGTVSELGQMELSWRSVDQLWTFPRLWMLCLRGANYITLPTADLDESTRAFVLSQVEKHGGTRV